MGISVGSGSPFGGSVMILIGIRVILRSNNKTGRRDHRHGAKVAEVGFGFTVWHHALPCNINVGSRDGPTKSGGRRDATKSLRWGLERHEAMVWIGYKIRKKMRHDYRQLQIHFQNKTKTYMY